MRGIVPEEVAAEVQLGALRRNDPRVPTSRRLGGPCRPGRTLGCLLVALVLGGLAASPGASARPLRLVPAYPASVSIAGHARRIPSSFLGLSIEYQELAQYAQLRGPVDNVIGLLQAGDVAPLILRIGGASADRTWWKAPGQSVLPIGVLGIGPPWLAELHAIVARDRLSVLLDLNLAAHTPEMAARFISAARASLGRALVGVEVGNEPDHYGRQSWLLRQLSAATERVSRHWNHDYTPDDYSRDYRGYAKLLRATYPRLAIGAPDIASPAVRWIQPLLRMGRLDPNFVSVHRYASSSCWPKDSPRYPSVPLLLSNRVTTGLAGSVGHMIAYAKERDTPLRIGEMGTISCGGNAGVANSFATALWAPDALFEFLQAGAIGVNWHLRPEAYNAPFSLGKASIRAWPVLYGMTMFAQMIGGSGAELLRTSVTAPNLNLKVWAVGEPRADKVLVLNKGRRTAAVSINSLHAATVGRLTAGGPRATSGVRFEGRWIGADGRWHGRLRLQRISPHAGLLRVTVPGFSAAMLEFRR